MIPQRRLETLLEQAKAHQRLQCRYHASDATVSLYADHHCDRSVFPTVTTHVLGGHTDEVWRVEFSHDGAHLATTSADGTVQIWTTRVSSTLRVGMPPLCNELTGLTFVTEHILAVTYFACRRTQRGHHKYSVVAGRYNATLRRRMCCQDLRCSCQSK